MNIQVRICVCKYYAWCVHAICIYIHTYTEQPTLHTMHLLSFFITVSKHTRHKYIHKRIHTYIHAHTHTHAHTHRTILPAYNAPLILLHNRIEAHAAQAWMPTRHALNRPCSIHTEQAHAFRIIRFKEVLFGPFGDHIADELDWICVVYYGLDRVDPWVVWVSGKGKDVGHRVGVLWRENCVE